MHPIIVLALFSGIAVTAGIFLSVYFLVIKNENSLMFGLLAGLYLAVSIRIAKSIFYFMTGIPEIGVALGFVGLASIGPFVWLYIKYSKSSNIKFSKTDLLHFTLPILGFLPVWLIGEGFPTIMYKFSTFVLSIYLVIAWNRYFKADYSQAISQNWNRLVLISVSVIWSAFVYQHASDTIIDYAVGAGIASLLMYILLAFALKNPVLFPKINPIKIDSRVVQKLKRAIEEEKIYQKPALTLSQFAQEIEEPSYLLSKALKSEFGKSFPELMNHFRIRDVKNRLSTANGDFIKIEGLAYEVGFNTPSAFYAAFKKETSLSPKEFQKQVLSIQN